VAANVIRKSLRNYRVGGTAAEALERLLKRCRQHGITPVLVGVPVSIPYRELYTPEIDGPFLSYMNQMAQTYRCQFVDYRDRVPDSLFLDQHHCNLEGGIYFSEKLSREILAPAWRSCRRNKTGA
jgi:hypothetical protein